MSVTLELPFPPSANRLWRRGKGKGLYISPEYKAWRKAADQTIMVERTKDNARIWGRFTAKIVLDAHRSKRRIDADNFVKPVMDALTRMMVIDDDSLADSVEVVWGESNGAWVELREAAT